MSAGLTLKCAKIYIRNKKIMYTIGWRNPAGRALGVKVVRKFYNISLSRLECKKKDSAAQVVDSLQKALSFYLMLPKSQPVDHIQQRLRHIRRLE